MQSTIPSGKHSVSNARLTGSTFHNVCLGGAAFDDINLQDSTFHNINLAGARFEDVNMSNVQISNVHLTGMTINGILVADLLKAYQSQIQPP
jgi:uncharacterized protein YjbI with pentapeptide repeats